MKHCLDCGSPFPASTEECPRCGSSRKENADPLIGAVFIDKYEIEEKLGTGGTCDVYRARHVRIGKAVAIKVLRPELAADPKVVERFEREARAASLVRHPNVIDIMDYGVAAGNRPFLVMELVEGATVRQLLMRDGAMTVGRVAGIISQVCAALEAAHAVGVIHRDIKPQNIIISEIDGRDWVKVVDFGIAKIHEDISLRATLTGANLIIGTPRYMSPEQAEEKSVDARSDIYSLGVVVYEMLAGRPPFSGSSATRLLIAHTVEPPPPLAEQRPDISPTVAAVVMRALDKDPVRRQQSALEFACDFAITAELTDRSISHIVQALLSGKGDARPADAGPPREAGDAATAFTGEGEETLVRRDTRGDQRPAGIGPAPPAISETDGPLRSAGSEPATARDRRGRRRVALLAGLLVLALAAVLVAYFTTHQNTSPDKPPISQEADDTAMTNTNANSPLPPSPPVQTEGGQSNTASPPAAAKTEDPPPDAPVDTGKAENQVRDAVNRWNAALEARNLDEHMAYYAPRLRTYFLKDNIDRNAARAEVANTMSRYSRLKIRTSPLEVSVDPSGTHAVVTYEKSWDFEGKQPWSGATVERLWLDRLNGRWRITGVRDLKQIR